MASLHVSLLSAYYKCPYQVYLKRTLGPTPPGTAILCGLANDRAHEADLNNIIKAGRLLAIEQTNALVEEYLRKQWRKGVYLAPDERGKGRVLEAAIRKALRMNQIRRLQCAPHLRPIKVKHQWRIPLPGCSPFDCLEGEADVLEEGDVISDLKSRSKYPARNEARKSLQGTMYAMERFLATGRPWKFRLDTICDVQNKESITTAYKPSAAEPRTRADFDCLLRRIEDFIGCVRKELYPPCEPTNPLCSPDFCGYYEGKCKYVVHAARG